MPDRRPCDHANLEPVYAYARPRNLQVGDTVAVVNGGQPVAQRCTACGSLRPPPLGAEEQAKRDAFVAELEGRRAVAARDLPAALRRLDSLDDPVSRAVLDLHRRETTYTTWWTCQGCDLDGYDAESPRWPCRTIETVASLHGIDLTDFDLLARPTDGSLDQEGTSE